MAIKCDIRNEDDVKNAIKEIENNFNKIDVLINNASAISLTDTLNTTMKKYDLMHQVNARGTFMVTKYCIPLLIKSNNPHVIMNSPPLSLDPKWFGNHTA